MAKPKILVTGGAGYIGSVISNLLLKANYKVRVVDALWFKKDIPSMYQSNPNYEFVKGDICNVSVQDKIVKDIDFVIHAAAIVGEPASNKFPKLTEAINHEASIRLIRSARLAGVKGFIFFSTCSNYGVAQGLASEKMELKPMSLYAKTKVKVEKHLMEQKEGINWVICRLATVYGVSMRMRFDLTVNDFTLNAHLGNQLDIFLPYTYRPYVHVSDVANVVLAMIENFDGVKNDVFNVGFNSENYQKIQIAEAVKKLIPSLRINITDKGADLRDYRVDFSKLQNTLGLDNTYSVEKGIRQVIDLLESGAITNPQDSTYYNTSPDLGT